MVVEENVLYDISQKPFINRVIKQMSFSFILITIIFITAILQSIRKDFSISIILFVAVVSYGVVYISAKRKVNNQLLKVTEKGRVIRFEYLDNSVNKNFEIPLTTLIVEAKHCDGRTSKMELIVQEKGEVKYSYIELATIYSQHEFGELVKKIQKRQASMVNSNVPFVEFENRTKFRLSKELKSSLVGFKGVEGDFISNVRPFQEWVLVKDYSWFSKTIFNEYEEKEIKDCFVIGDIMIDSHQWAIRLNTEGTIEPIIELDKYGIVASSFSKFLVTVDIDPWSLVAD
jgi:hypothetical protein